jgi:hypothetical protein
MTDTPEDLSERPAAEPHGSASDDLGEMIAEPTGRLRSTEREWEGLL